MNPSLLRVQLRKLQDGHNLGTQEINLTRNRPLSFLELCNTMLLLKQSGANLKVYDLLTGSLSMTPKSCEFDPQAVTFLAPENGCDQAPVCCPLCYVLGFIRMSTWKSSSPVLICCAHSCATWYVASHNFFLSLVPQTPNCSSCMPNA
eukprot:Gregarina_sp_Poly_1__10417@NODE_74_length_15926_cov_73_224289_g63_i0_p9_GENE_NODE_74_length_15926_cov_73_224289_g63_i0NODE_74_length_15926_cov_73_224289_g63_i0_p9_ORF_typecomplete_len148_score9_35_NODE_74_length_15926_cov_73_224289_g63_i01012410567